MDLATYAVLNKKIDSVGNVPDEKITEAVNTYLEENPVAPGATSEQAEQIQDNTNKITELKGDIDTFAKYKDDNPIYTFEQGTIRYDGYIVKDNLAGIYTPNAIYFSKETIFKLPSEYSLTFFKYVDDAFVISEAQLSASGYYKMCIRKVDNSNVSVDEANNLIIDEKPRISKLESEVAGFEGDIADLFIKGKNLIDTSICFGESTKNVDGITGEVIDGTCSVYGYYKLNVGEKYTISKATSSLWMRFYSSENVYAGELPDAAMSGTENVRTFVAEYPLLLIVAYKTASEQSIMLEVGDTRSAYEPYKKELNAPIIGYGTELNTKSKTIIPAINELHSTASNNASRITSLEARGSDIVKTGANILDYSKVLASGNGAIDSNGNLVAGDMNVYGYFDLENGKTYTLSRTGKLVCLYFYNDDTYVSSMAIGGGEFTKTFVANGDRLIIAMNSTVTAESIKLQVEKGDTVTTYETFFKYLDKDVKVFDRNLRGKKVLVIGDSISTDAYGDYKKWCTVLIEEGFFPVDTVNSSQHASGYVVRFGTEENDYNSRIRSIANPETFDYVIVNGCFNDWNQNADFDTFKSAVDSFYEYVINNFVNAKILVMNSLKSFLCMNANPQGKMQSDYCDYVKEVADKYSFPFHDLHRRSGFAPHIPAFRSRWTLLVGDVYDGVHPNEEWERRFMAPQIKHFIEQYI